MLFNYTLSTVKHMGKGRVLRNRKNLVEEHSYLATREIHSYKRVASFKNLRNSLTYGGLARVSTGSGFPITISRDQSLGFTRWYN